MRDLLLASLIALPCAACTGSPASEDPAPARHLEPALATLGTDGVVSLAGRVFDLSHSAQAARLGLELRALVADLGQENSTLVLAARAGTPFTQVERLMAVLDAAGIEDYRLDLGR